MTVDIDHFFNKKIWLLHEHQFPAFKAFLFKALKITVLAYQGFIRDLCLLRASALTLYTLLAIVPIIAMLFGIAKGFGLEQLLQQQLFVHVPHQEKTVQELIKFAQNLLESTKGEVVAGIGIIVLLWTVINTISNIEESFNSIWKVSKGRSVSRKVSDYLSLMVLAPFLLILASSINVFLNTKIASWINLPEVSGLLLKVLNYFPLLLMVNLFALIFIFMPNHKVRYSAGFIAAAATGILYEFIQWIYLSLQIGVSSNNAIYGSLAALPLFVIWVQTGWMIVLFGCEIAFYIQNYEGHRHNYKFSEISFALKNVLALQVTHVIVKNFVHQGNPLTAEQIASHLHTSIAIVHPLLELLVNSQIVVELKTETDYQVYLPALDINLINVGFVINALEKCGENKLPDLQQEQLFTELLSDFHEWLETNDKNCLLKDI